jgi:hypothetical protein
VTRAGLALSIAFGHWVVSRRFGKPGVPSGSISNDISFVQVLQPHYNLD